LAHWLYAQDAYVMIVVVCLFFLLVYEVTFRIGRSLAPKSGDRAPAQGQAIEASILTLFGLLLGFTFSMASVRYEERRETVVHESNAIGTAWLRASLLEPETANELRLTLRQYLDARIELYAAPFNAGELEKINAQTDHIQHRAWQIASTQARLHPTPTHALVISALNEMIDLREKQMSAFENIVPGAVKLFLLMFSFIAVGVVGYLNGMSQNRQKILSFTFVAVVSMTLLLIADMDRPRRGAVKLSYETLLRLQAGMADSSMPRSSEGTAD
jgi:hypothetical protein